MVNEDVMSCARNKQLAKLTVVVRSLNTSKIWVEIQLHPSYYLSISYLLSFKSTQSNIFIAADKLFAA